MNIDQFLVSKQPLERQVTLPDGTQHTLYFLEPTAADIRRIIFAEQSNDENQRLYASQELVAACLYDPILKRRVFDDPDHPHKHRELKFEASEAMARAILDIAKVPQQKKASP